MLRGSRRLTEVHFSILGRDDCPLKGPAPGEEAAESSPEEAVEEEVSEEEKPRRKRSRTPDVWEQERRRVLATQVGEPSEEWSGVVRRWS